MPKSTVVSLLIVIGLLAGIYLLGDRLISSDNLADEITATYVCPSGEFITARYGFQQVELELSDGRKIRLAQAISASGVRFTNSTDTIVFWNKGNIAQLEEGGRLTFSDCRQEIEVNLDNLDRRATDFTATGVVTYDTPGLEPGVPYFIFERPGEPGLTRRLVFDETSWCGTPDGGTMCLAMSVATPLAGVRANLEGITDGQAVLVRKLQSVTKDNLSFNPSTLVYISWPTARQLIEACQVSMLTQTHSLNIYLSLVDGTEVVTVEPMIDEVFPVVEQSRDECGVIPLATE